MQRKTKIKIIKLVQIFSLLITILILFEFLVTGVNSLQITVLVISITTFLLTYLTTIKKPASYEITKPLREYILTMMEKVWIEDGLNSSIHGAAMLSLGKKVNSSAVSPQPLVIRSLGEKGQFGLPNEKSILDIWKENGLEKGLLILGGPGSGKTTTLLQLTEELINIARCDLLVTIPIVLNLSRWRLQRKPLDQWIIDEIDFRYGIGKSYTQTGIEKGEFTFLLDGLDEVIEWNLECELVDQINLFHEQFITIPIIVTCRDKDYFDLPKKLNLEGAIELQDLNEKQIFDYLNSPGNEMKAVQASLKHDAALRELAKKPLFLSIMVLAYQGKTIEELKPLDSIEARRKHLLNNYISRMFIHKSKLFNNKSKSTHKTLFNNFTLEKTVYWLIWLARQMIKNKGLPFLIEGLQPDLLENPKQKNLYFALYRTIIVVLWAIPTSIAAYFAAKNVGQRLFQINLGVGFSLGIGLFVAIAGWIGIRRRFNIWGGLALGIATGIAFFLPLSDVTSVNNSLLISSLLALFAGVVVVIAGPALTGSNNESPQVEIIESIIPKFPTRPFRTALISIGIGTISAISAKVMFVIFHLQANWINILAIGVCFLFITVSFSGLTWQDKIQTRKYPNQGITRSLYRSILMGISILIISSILIGIGLIQLGSALAYSVAILIGAFFGITGFLKYGGITTIKHYSLRFLLSVYGYLPFSLISFLNYSCQLIFLKKLGNIYKFTHDILRDHFASIPFDETAIHEILFSKYSLG